MMFALQDKFNIIKDYVRILFEDILNILNILLILKIVLYSSSRA